MSNNAKHYKVTIVVDNDSWILPYAEILLQKLLSQGHSATLARKHEDIEQGDIAFYLGCIRITPPAILALHTNNLACHESKLPHGRGFSPLTWQIIEGQNDIPISLFELEDGVDSGPIYIQQTLSFKGHELIDELRDMQGRATIDICLSYINNKPEAGIAQTGEPTYYRRRTPADSELDAHKPLAEQFDLLRTVDNEKYPAYFMHKGKKYILHIREALSD